MGVFTKLCPGGVEFAKIMPLPIRKCSKCGREYCIIPCPRPDEGLCKLKVAKLGRWSGAECPYCH